MRSPHNEQRIQDSDTNIRMEGGGVKVKAQRFDIQNFQFCRWVDVMHSERLVRRDTQRPENQRLLGETHMRDWLQGSS
jgi:hypothetical protein